MRVIDILHCPIDYDCCNCKYFSEDGKYGCCAKEYDEIRRHPLTGEFLGYELEFFWKSNDIKNKLQLDSCDSYENN